MSDQIWGVRCKVWGGITGARESWLKRDGCACRFATEQEAQAEATKMYESLGMVRTAQFHYYAERFGSD